MGKYNLVETVLHLSIHPIQHYWHFKKGADAQNMMVELNKFFFLKAYSNFCYF